MRKIMARGRTDAWLAPARIENQAAAAANARILIDVNGDPECN